jgi:hypothetical protein
MKCSIPVHFLYRHAGGRRALQDARRRGRRLRARRGCRRAAAADLCRAEPAATGASCWQRRQPGRPQQRADGAKRPRSAGGAARGACLCGPGAARRVCAAAARHGHGPGRPDRGRRRRGRVLRSGHACAHHQQEQPRPRRAGCGRGWRTPRRLCCAPRRPAAAATPPFGQPLRGGRTAQRRRRLAAAPAASGRACCLQAWRRSVWLCQRLRQRRQLVCLPGGGAGQLGPHGLGGCRAERERRSL